jgi:3-hydroxybutyryl-CoA dehydrogenase
MDVAVLGADEIGEALGARCVRHGHRVRLAGQDANAVMDAVDGVERATDRDATTAIDGTTDLEAAVADADVVVDTRPAEDIERARAHLADVEEHADDEALIATGNPRQSVSAVVAGLRRPGRSIGLHVLDPDTPIVEAIVADQTTSEARERAVSFVESIDWIPIVVADAPGVVTPRLDFTLVGEAIRMVEDGVASIEDVDRAMTLGRGHEVGPLALADEIGLDRVLSALDGLTERLGDRFEPPQLLREKVAEGSLGKATGRGFYVWEGAEPAEPASPNPTVDTREGGRGPAEP